MRTILYLVTIAICSLTCSNIQHVELNCDFLVKIDSLEFSKNYTNTTLFDQKSDLTKINNSINVEGLNTSFKDNLCDEQFIEYSVIGKYKKWNLIRGQDQNQNYYFLLKENNIDSLIGYPKIYKNTILSIEEEYTDFQEYIEIWEIDSNEKLFLRQKFTLKKCYSFRIMDSYISNNDLFLRTGLEFGAQNFYKIRIR